VLAVTQGLITAVDNPLRQAFIFEMVGRDNLINAVGLNSMSFQGARVFGPALAGVVIKLIGIAPTLVLNALSFIPVIWALLLMDAKSFFSVPPSSRGSMLGKLAQGLTFASRTPTVLSILIVAGFIGTFGFNFSVVVPLVANNILNTDATGFGFLSAAMGVGALIAAVGTAYVRQVTIRRLLISGGLFSLFLGLLALSTSFWLSAFLFIIVGIAGITCITTANSLLQLNTPEELRGRVLSINTLLTLGSTPIGGFFLGGLGELAGVETAIMACAVLCLLGVGVAVLYRWRLAHAAPNTPQVA
jgi:MFS family permease